MKRFLYLAALLLAASLFNACQKDLPPTEDSLAYLPKDAVMVSAFRLGQLMDKAGLDALIASEGAQAMLQDIRKEAPIFAQILADPASSGVDFSKKAYLSMYLDEEGAPSGLMAFSLQSATDFEALLQAMELERTPAQNGFAYATSQQSTTGPALAWNEDVALLNLDGKSEASSLEQYLQTTYKASMANNRELREALEGDYDVLNWFSSNHLLGVEPVKNALGLLNYSDKELKGQYVAHALTFEEGAVLNELKLDLRGRLEKDLSMLFRDQPKADFLAQSPAGEPIFFLTAAFDIKGINQLLVEKYSKGAAEKALSSYGLSAKDILQTFTGDIMLAAYDEENLLFAAAVKEQPLRETLQKAVEDGGLEALSENRYRFFKVRQAGSVDSMGVRQKGFDFDGQLLLHQGLLFFSSQPEMMDQIEAGQLGMSGPVAERAAQSAGDNIFTAIGNPRALDALSNDFQDLSAVSAKADRDGVSLRLDLGDARQNSLQYLFERMLKEEDDSGSEW